MSMRVLKLIPTAFPFQLLSDLQNCNALSFIYFNHYYANVRSSKRLTRSILTWRIMHNTVHSLKSQREPRECIAFSRAFLPYLRAVTCLFSQFQQSF